MFSRLLISPTHTSQQNNFIINWRTDEDMNKYIFNLQTSLNSAFTGKSNF